MVRPFNATRERETWVDIGNPGLVHLPFAASLPDGRRMSTRYISCARRRERVGAQDKHRLVREVLIQSLFVVEEVGPLRLLQLWRAGGLAVCVAAVILLAACRASPRKKSTPEEQAAAKARGRGDDHQCGQA